MILTLLAFAALPAVQALSSQSFQLHGPQAVNLWRIQQRLRLEPGSADGNGTTVAAALPPGVVQSTFTQPLDHFDSKNHLTFKQRYWVNPQFYKEGGPVIILDGGETSGTDRLPYIVTGVAAKLANATGGLALVLEHRYYGDSIPVDNFSTDALRWLTNDQALTDSANFMTHVDFSAATGIKANLTAPGTPWIYYGGSYAGARSAHMKVKFPEIVYGAIASSGVTHASVSLWQYFDVVRQATPDCSPAFVKAVETINIALSRPDLNAPLKRLFGLEELADDDFASIITSPLGGWQNSNWDPAVDGNSWTPFCNSIAAKPSDASQQTGRIGNLTVDYPLLNYANFSQTQLVAQCLRANLTIPECYATTDDSAFQVDDLSQTWRTWQFQVCTAWGFFMPSPPAGVPPVVAKPLTLPYLQKICKQAYPPGKFFQVPKDPDVESVNVLGGFHIAADRLAIVDGEKDPWRPATAHSQYANLSPRPDTPLRPFKLIPGAVHHYDENGLANQADEPPEIQAIHEAEIEFVKGWLKDFKPHKL